VPGSVGILYLWAADSIRKGTPHGLEVGLGANANSCTCSHRYKLQICSRCFCFAATLLSSSRCKGARTSGLGCYLGGFRSLLWKSHVLSERIGTFSRVYVMSHYKNMHFIFSRCKNMGTWQFYVFRYLWRATKLPVQVLVRPSPCTQLVPVDFVPTFVTGLDRVTAS